MVRTSSAVNVCTAERLERRTEGKAEALDFVVMVVDEVSLFSVPQISHMIRDLFSPEDDSRRFPHAVQKTREPIAAIFGNV